MCPLKRVKSNQTGTPLHFHSSTTSGSACLMRARTWESVLPLQSSSSLILASISREGDSPLVVALFAILLAPHSAVFPPRRHPSPSSAPTGLAVNGAADFSLSVPGPAPDLQRTAATRIWRPGRPAADPAGSPTAPCAGGSPCSWG